jgi:hypothetical protein
MEGYIGQILLFAGLFAPKGWRYCDGSLLPSIKTRRYSAFSAPPMAVTGRQPSLFQIWRRQQYRSAGSDQVCHLHYGHFPFKTIANSPIS